jgi:hypothetical protein
MPNEKITVDPDVVAGLGNDMMSIAMRLRSPATAAGRSHLASLGRAGDGSSLAQTYAHAAQTVLNAGDALSGALETNGQYVLYAAQNADDAFN